MQADNCLVRLKILKPDLAWLKKRGVVRVQKEQLAVPVAACVWLQPQNTEDESRGTTLAQRKAMRDLQGMVVEPWSKLANFPSANNGEGRTAMQRDNS